MDSDASNDSGYRFSIDPNVDSSHVDPRLVSTVKEATRYLPPGYSAVMKSGFRAGDPRFHGAGQALDIQLIDPNGKPLPNYQAGKSFQAYEGFAQTVHQLQPVFAPDAPPIRWGGYFPGPRGLYGAADLMHFDTGNNGDMGGGGTWDHGLSFAQRNAFPDAVSSGLADRPGGSSSALGFAPIKASATPPAVAAINGRNAGAPADFAKDFDVAGTPGAKSASVPPADFLKDFDVAPSKGGGASAPAASAAAPTNVPEFERDFQVAPTQSTAATSSTPASSAATLPGVGMNVAALPNGPVASPAATAGPLTSAGGVPYSDPRSPLTRMLAPGLANAEEYAASQLSSIPGSIWDNAKAGAALAGQGLSNIWNGHALPATTISPMQANPATIDRGELDLFGRPVLHSVNQWPNRVSGTPGGLAQTVGGVAAMATAPLSGTVQKAVTEPVTALTGSPEIGDRAGMVAGALGGPVLARAYGAAQSALGDATLGRLDPESAKLASSAVNKWGIPLSAPQMAGTPGVAIASSALNRLPFSGAEGFAEKQSDAWNHAVASTIGEDATRLTPDVMNSARKRIGGYYDSVAANTNLNIDQKFADDLRDTMTEAAQTLQEQQLKPLVNQVQNIAGKIDPTAKTISGATYQAITSQGAPLDRLIDSADPNVGYYANKLKKVLDGALARSASPADQDLLATADKQWASLKTIQPLAAKAPTGQISPALLAGRVNANTGNGMAFGWGGDLGELARIGQRFLKEPGSSNTAERAATYGMMGGAAKLAAGTGVGALGLHGAGINLPAMSIPELAAGAAAIPTGLLAARGVGSALRSQWLGNALLNRSLNRYGGGSALSAPLAVSGAVTGSNPVNPPVNSP